jgi:hypothetical protein
MLLDLEFDGIQINPGADDDPITAGQRVTSGNTGIHSTKYDVGYERLVCSNGMTAFVPEAEFEQTHHEQLDTTLPRLSVEAILDSTDHVEQKLEQAQANRFRNKEEALAVLYDLEIPQRLQLDHAETAMVFEDEVADRNNASQYELYQVATNMIDNHSPDYMDDHGQHSLHQQASQLMDTGTGQLQDVDDLAESSLQSRAYELTEEEVEEYWEGETEDLRAALEDRGLTA